MAGGVARIQPSGSEIVALPEYAAVALAVPVAGPPLSNGTNPFVLAFDTQFSRMIKAAGAPIQPIPAALQLITRPSVCFIGVDTLAQPATPHTNIGAKITA